MSRRRPDDRRHFSKAALAAAVEARRKRQERGVARGIAEIFVVRSRTSPPNYEWEIRRFGGLVLERCQLTFACPEKARAAGVAALIATGL